MAYSATLGITPVDPEVEAVTRKAAQRFSEAGVIVEEAHPDYSEAHECFGVLRAYAFACSLKPLYDTQKHLLKPDVVWNIEKGLALTMADLTKAEEQRVAMFNRTIAFFESYDLLLTPATIVGAYPVEQRFVAECNGYTFPDYVQWLSIAYALTLVSCPALSLPSGFLPEGRPIGLQIAAPPFGEERIFAGAKLLEEILDLDTTRPIDPR